jgi:2-methylaconitate cis-trans-isomerase PrpF
MALSTACVLPGTVAADLAVLPKGQVQTIVIEHPSGVIEIEIEASGTGQADFALHQASLIRTCRKLFEGLVCIPSRVWAGQGAGPTQRIAA